VSDKVKAADIRHALLKHFAPPGWRVFFEVSDDTGARAKRSIDALACGIWPSNGYEIIGIEIKVSRSDWQREMAEPAKAQELMRYCNRWYLAAPKGMVKPDELPATWGLLTFGGDKIRTEVKAPRLSPEPLDVGFVMSVLRRADAVDNEMIRRIVDERDAERKKSFDLSVESAAQRRVADVSRRQDTALKVAEVVKAITGADITDWNCDPKALAAAYLLMRSSRLHESIGYGDDTVPGVLESLKRAQQGLAGLFEHEVFAEIRAQIAAAEPVRRAVR